MAEQVDYKAVYDDFWKEIVENEDGTLNLDQVQRELSDYYSAMELVPRAYSEVTGDRISKLLTDPSAVAEEAEHHYYVWAADAVLDRVDEFHDMTEAEIRAAILDALNLKEKDL
jgi:hypothetical protein